MKTNASGRQEMVMKIAFIALVLLLSGSMFSSGVMASEGCGMNSPQEMQFSGESSSGCMACCGLGKPHCLCQARSSQPVEMPVVFLVSSASFHLYPCSLTRAPVQVLDGLLYRAGGINISFSKKAAVSPPLFLANLSIII